MPKATVKWVGANQFVGMDSKDNAVVLSGDDYGGVSPSEMLLVALSSCTAVDVVEIMRKKRKPLSSLEIVANGERDPDPPWPYRKIHLMFRAKGDNITEKAIQQAIELSQKKYCSVAATVRGVADITTDFEIL